MKEETKIWLKVKVIRNISKFGLISGFEILPSLRLGGHP